MKKRILRSVLLVAYLGFALSGQLGTLQTSAVTGSNAQSVHATLGQIGK